MAMKKSMIILLALFILIFIIFMFGRETSFPSDAQSEFDMQLKSWGGNTFSYQITSLENVSNFSADGPWCIQIKPGVRNANIASGKTQEISHFSMIKEGKLWILVPYDDVNQTNWLDLGCGDWE